MKVVNELVRYFLFNGALSAKDWLALVKSGWHMPDWDDLDSDVTMFWGDCDYDYEPEWQRAFGECDSAEEALGDRHLLRRKMASVKRPRVAPAGARATVLEAWLAARWPAWEQQLAPLRCLSAANNPASLSIEAAALQIRTAVDCRQFAWRELWAALALNGFRDWFCEPSAHGPATRAFRAMLEGENLSDLTKYRWILRHPTIATACESALAQRRLLLAGNHLLEHAPDWIARQVRRSKDRLSLFILTVADTVRRSESATHADAAGELLPPPDGVPPFLPLPPGPQRLSALLAATLMNPRRMLPFLQHRTPTWQPGSLVKAGTYSSLGLRCPLAWNPHRLPEPNSTAEA